MTGALLAVLTTAVVVGDAALAERGGVRSSWWPGSSSSARPLCLRAQGAAAPGPRELAAAGRRGAVRMEGPADHAATGRRRVAAAGAAVAAGSADRPARRGAEPGAYPAAARRRAAAAAAAPGAAGPGDPARRRPARRRCGSRARCSRCWRWPGWRCASRGRRHAGEEHPGQARPARHRRRAGRASPACSPCRSAPGRPAATKERVILRSHVDPPFDVGQYPSPLASFRRYVELPRGQTARSTCTTRRCSPSRACPPAAASASPCSTATTAWCGGPATTPSPASSTTPTSASRASSTTRSRAPPSTRGSPIGPGWSGVWLPTVGALQTLRFLSGDREGLSESFRYNLATSSAVVPAGVRPGDVYTFTARRPGDELTPETATVRQRRGGGRCGGLPRHPGRPVVGGRAAADAPGVRRRPAPQVRGQVLRRRDREREDLPRRPQPLPPDRRHRRRELAVRGRQRRAVRRVDGAAGQPHRRPRPRGLRRDRARRRRGTGADVHAWVELQVADGSWRTLPTELFMDDDRPAEQQTTRRQQLSGSVVPPPAPIPPPSTAGEQNDADMKVRKNRSTAKKAADEAAGPVPRWVGRAGPLRRRPGARDHRSCSRRWWSPSCCAAGDGVPGRRSRRGSSAPGASWSTTPATSASPSRSGSG